MQMGPIQFNTYHIHYSFYICVTLGIFSFWYSNENTKHIDENRIEVKKYDLYVMKIEMTSEDKCIECVCETKKGGKSHLKYAWQTYIFAKTERRQVQS